MLEYYLYSFGMHVAIHCLQWIPRWLSGEWIRGDSEFSKLPTESIIKWNCPRSSLWPSDIGEQRTSEERSDPEYFENFKILGIKNWFSSSSSLWSLSGEGVFGLFSISCISLHSLHASLVTAWTLARTWSRPWDTWTCSNVFESGKFQLKIGIKLGWIPEIFHFRF